MLLEGDVYIDRMGLVGLISMCGYQVVWMPSTRSLWSGDCAALLKRRKAWNDFWCLEMEWVVSREAL